MGSQIAQPIRLPQKEPKIIGKAPTSGRPFGPLAPGFHSLPVKNSTKLAFILRKNRDPL